MSYESASLANWLRPIQATTEPDEKSLRVRWFDVHAVCDLDNIPIYVGRAARSRDTSIRKRVQRHLTSARSDVIANRQIDVWEIAFVRAWTIDDPQQRVQLEAYLFHHFNDQSPLANGTIPVRISELPFAVPTCTEVQVMEVPVILARKEAELRSPRLIQHWNQLVDYILNTQDKPHLRRALQVYFNRLGRYFHDFLQTTSPSAPVQPDEED